MFSQQLSSVDDNASISFCAALYMKLIVLYLQQVVNLKKISSTEKHVTQLKTNFQRFSWININKFKLFDSSVYNV